MKNLKIFVILLCIPSFIRSQTNPGLWTNIGLSVKFQKCNGCGSANDDSSLPLFTYDLPDTLHTEHVTSDFGIRDIAGGTRFHQGIDMRPRQGVFGDAILAIELGQIKYISLSTEKLIRVLVQGNNKLVYLHFFPHGVTDGYRSGNFVYKETNNGRAAIVDLINCKAYCNQAGDTVYYNNICNLNSDPTKSFFITTDSIQQGSPIGPIGDSGLPPKPNKPRPPHLHLSLVKSLLKSGNTINKSPDDDENNSLDAWMKVEHPVTLWDEKIKSTNNTNWWQITPKYGGSPTSTTLLMECRMASAQAGGGYYRNVAMNKQKVEILIRDKQQGGFSYIKGGKHESKFVINPVNENIYPDIPWHKNGFGSTTRTGLKPFAYASSATPYDEFYFADFYTRIHKDDIMNPNRTDTIKLAKYPWDARFKDGRYELKTKITDVRGIVIDTTTPNPYLPYFQIDNFNPFIFLASAVFSNGPDDGVYARAWKPTKKGDGEIELGLRTTKAVYDLDAPGSLTIYAVSSEAMDGLKVRIPSPAAGVPAPLSDTSWVVGVKQSHDIFGKELWKFEMGSGTFRADTCYRMEFDGKDVVGNQLLNYELPANCGNNSLIKLLPHRKGATSWANQHAQGFDRVHFINISSCGDNQFAQNEACTLSAEDVESSIVYASQQQSNGAISLSISGEHSNIIFKWMDSSGNIIATTRNLENVPAGTYCIEIKEECCMVSGCFEVGECKTDMVPQLTHPTQAEPNSGEIILSITDGIEPYTYQWAGSTQTGPDRTGLPVGTYCVTVTDGNGCQVVSCPELIHCPTISLNPTTVVQKPNSCTAADGWVKILDYNISGPYQAEYEYSFFSAENGQTYTADIYGKFQGLASGAYIVSVKDIHTQCTAYKMLNLLAENYPGEINVDIHPACEDIPNGRISIGVVGTSTFTFEWQDLGEGVETQDGYISDVSEIYEGNYCVTITSDVGECVIEKCYDVPSLVPSSPLGVSAAVVHPCPRNNSGSINLTVSGGIAPYTFDWADLSVFEDGTENRSDLLAGPYSVTVTDYCGNTEVYAIELTELEFQHIEFTPDCEEDGTASVIVTGGNTPYTYIWKNGAVGASINGLASGEYCLTVTDGAGCTLEACVSGENKHAQIVETVKPCTNVNQSGGLTFEIFNPSYETVKIYNEGLLLLSQTTGGIFTYTVEGLSPNVYYHIDIHIGGCVSSFTERITPSPLTPVFNNFEERTGCIYDLYCNGELIASEGYSEPPFLDFANAKSIPCQVERKCKGHSLGWMSFATKKVRAYEYELVLAAASASGYNVSVSDLISRFENSGLTNCDVIRYCPATLEYTSNSIFNSINGDGTLTTINSHCKRLQCGCCYDEILCEEAVVPEIWNPSQFDVAACLPRRYNAYQLIIWRDQIEAWYENIYGSNPGFEGTELGQKIDELEAIYTGGIPTPEPARVHCMFVTFCSSDFTVLNVTDINSVICWDPLYPDLGGCEYSSTLGLTRCVNPTTFTNYVIPIRPAFPGNFLIVPGGPESPNVFTTIAESDDYFDKFGYLVQEGVVTPKGIFRTASGEKKFVDYNYRATVLTRKNVPGLAFYFDDWDNDQLAFIERLASVGNVFSINFEGEENAWQKNLSANTYLEVSDAKKSAGGILVSGWFQGTLMLNDSTIATSLDTTAYLLHFNLGGGTEKFNTFQNLSVTSELSIKQSEEEYSVSGTCKSDWISIDGAAPIPVEDTKFFEIRNSDGAGYEKENNEIETQGDVRLLKSVSSSDQTRITRMFGGEGSITLPILQEGGVIPIPNTYELNLRSVLLVTMDSAGTILWVRSINYLPVVDKEIDITYGNDLALYLGVTFEQDLTIDDVTFYSNGGKDILVGKIDRSGGLYGAAQYGSDQDEVLKQCLFDNGVLYLGGDYSGLNEIRTIGRKQFIQIGTNSDEHITKGYITYLLDEDLISPVSFRGTAETSQKVWVSPNPFSSAVSVQMNAVKEGFVQMNLLDALGKQIRKASQTVIAGSNNLQINDLSTIPNGIYFLQVSDAEGKRWVFRLLKN